MNERTRILIADDHPLVLGALRHALTGAIEGAEFHEARDLESLSAALEAAPDMDLVLLDLSMPGVRGFSGLIYLRAQHAGVPVIVVSANRDPAVMRACIDLGAAGDRFEIAGSPRRCAPRCAWFWRAGAGFRPISILQPAIPARAWPCAASPR